MIRQMKTTEGNELRRESDYVDGIGVLWDWRKETYHRQVPSSVV